MEAQWVIAVASSIGALGILGVFYQSYTAFSQLKITAKQLDTSIKDLKADHERSRREKAIDLLAHWDRNIKLSGALSRKFAETLSFEQSKSLFKQQSFEVDPTHAELFLGSLSNISSKNRDIPTEKFKVSERESSEIRWGVISYLNHLETILAAVRHNIADKDMIYEQFTYLVAPTEGHYVLEHFRKAAGGSDSYPSIEEFATELKNKHETNNSGKKKIA